MPLPFMSTRDLFRGVPEAEARRIAALFLERRFPADSRIFARGDEARSVLIVRGGLVKLVAVSEQSHESILHILRAGDVFGELVAAEGRRPFSAVAMTDAVVGILPGERFLELLSAVPPFGRAVLAMLSKRLHQVEEGFADLIHAWAWHRLAAELLHLASDLGRDGPGGTLIPLRLTHEELSNLIGTSRETVTLQLKRFEELGMIRREGRQIIVDRARLSRYLHPVEG